MISGLGFPQSVQRVQEIDIEKTLETIQKPPENHEGNRWAARNALDQLIKDTTPGDEKITKIVQWINHSLDNTESMNDVSSYLNKLVNKAQGEQITGILDCIEKAIDNKYHDVRMSGCKALQNLAGVAGEEQFAPTLRCIEKALRTDDHYVCRAGAEMIEQLIKSMGKTHFMPIFRTVSNILSNTNHPDEVRLAASIALEHVVKAATEEEHITAIEKWIQTTRADQGGPVPYQDLKRFVGILQKIRDQI